MKLTGCGTALVTPFAAGGEAEPPIDEAALRSLVDWQIASGIDFLVACGTTAETPTLDDREWLQVIRLVAETAASRVPVWAGCTHNATREAVARARAAAQIPGVSAILTANPYYNRPTQEGQFRHFQAVANAVELPVVLYNIPARTGANLEPATVARLVEAAPNIEAVKESSGQLGQITELIHLLSRDRLPADFKVFSGDDPIALPVIAVGGAGLISVASNQIPAQMAQMVRSALNGDWTSARRINRKYFPLMQANFWETSPGPAKAILAMMGKLAEQYRLPIVPVAPATREKLRKLAAELGLLPDAPDDISHLRID
jgi:4-hydroxy-tetrahydrodipicolinate synthase